MAKNLNPAKYGKIWGTVSSELMTGAKAQNPQGECNQPIIGTLIIDGKRFELTHTETNRVIQELYDMQDIFKKAKRIGMLEAGTGTPRNIKYTTYDSDGNITSTNMKQEKII